MANQNTNISKQKRARLLSFLANLREKSINDPEALGAIAELENEINSKRYGLVWEEHEEEVDRQMRDSIPVFVEERERDRY